MIHPDFHDERQALEYERSLECECNFSNYLFIMIWMYELKVEQRGLDLAVQKFIDEGSGRSIEESKPIIKLTSSFMPIITNSVIIDEILRS